MRYEYQNRTNPVKVNNRYPTVMKVNGRPVYRMKKTDKGLIYEGSKIEAISFNNIANDNIIINRGYVQNPPIFSGQSYSYPILASSDLIWKRYVQDLEFKYTLQHYNSGRPIVESYLYLTYGLNQTTPNYRREGTLRNDDDIYHYAIYLNQLNTNNPKQIKYVNFPYGIEYNRTKRKNIPWYLNKIIPTYNSSTSKYLTYEINNHTLNNDPDNVYSFKFNTYLSNKTIPDDEILRLDDTLFSNTPFGELSVGRTGGRRLNNNYYNFTDISINDRNVNKVTKGIYINKWLTDSFGNNTTITLNSNSVITLKDIGYDDNVFNLNNADNFTNGSNVKDIVNNSNVSFVVLRLRVTNHLLNEYKDYYFKAYVNGNYSNWVLTEEKRRIPEKGHYNNEYYYYNLIYREERYINGQPTGEYRNNYDGGVHRNYKLLSEMNYNNVQNNGDHYYTRNDSFISNTYGRHVNSSNIRKIIGEIYNNDVIVIDKPWYMDITTINWLSGTDHQTIWSVDSSERINSTIIIAKDIVVRLNLNDDTETLFTLITGKAGYRSNIKIYTLPDVKLHVHAGSRYSPVTIPFKDIINNDNIPWYHGNSLANSDIYNDNEYYHYIMDIINHYGNVNPRGGFRAKIYGVSFDSNLKYTIKENIPYQLPN